MLLTIIAFIIVLGILVIVHEAGHFVAAKLIGVKVEEFAVGFPPRLFTKKRGETKYSINLLPLGGYVKMLGELEHSKDPRAFENQKPLKRFTISVAGVLMNVVLAWFILTIGFAIGMAPLVSAPDALPGEKISTEIIVAGVLEDSVAKKADLKQGDIFIKAEVEGKSTTFESLKQYDQYNADNKGKTVTYQIKRDKDELTKEIELSSDSDAQLGIVIVENAVIRVPWYKAPYVALHETYEIIKLTVVFLGDFFANLFSTGKVAEEVGGPVAIYAYTGLAVKAGLMVLLQFVAILSINLALLNILPFPALDGGRILFILIEGIAGKKIIKERVENIIHNIGFIVLIAAILAITYRDIAKFFFK